MSLTSSVPLGCHEILITMGDQPKAVEAGNCPVLIQARATGS
jgi:hypothetical protein